MTLDHHAYTVLEGDRWTRDEERERRGRYEPIVKGEAMGESKHTPGPLDVDNADTNAYGVFDENGRATCYVSENPLNGAGLRGIEEDRANAYLYAAAPDLLAALKEVVAIADRKTDEFDRARAAIAKAEGVAP